MEWMFVSGCEAKIWFDCVGGTGTKRRQWCQVGREQKPDKIQSGALLSQWTGGEGDALQAEMKAGELVGGLMASKRSVIFFSP